MRQLYTVGKPIQAFFFKLNLHKKKWPLSCSSDPYRNNIARHLEAFKSVYKKKLFLKISQYQ